jgi:phenylacetate-CoA ligase
MFVHPSHIHEVMRRHPAIKKARLIVTGQMANDNMTLHCEIDEAQTIDPNSIIATLRDLTKLRSDVQFVASGSLPHDGKMIDDLRDYR